MKIDDKPEWINPFLVKFCLDSRAIGISIGIVPVVVLLRYLGWL